MWKILEPVCHNSQSASLLSDSGLVIHVLQYTPCALILSALHLSHSDAPSRVKRLAEVLGSASGVFLQGGEGVKKECRCRRGGPLKKTRQNYWNSDVFCSTLSMSIS